jgi:hypothetical protein
MNKGLRVVTVLLTLLAIPSSVAAEFRRIEIKTLGMD